MALRGCGTLRILFAAFIGAIGKLFRKRGWFYIIAGPKASSIDGPCQHHSAYNECVVLGPLNPDETAADISKHIGYPVIIVDINDLGGNILGVSDCSMDRDLYARILKDNPLGQSGIYAYGDHPKSITAKKRHFSIGNTAVPEQEDVPSFQRTRLFSPPSGRIQAAMHQVDGRIPPGAFLQACCFCSTSRSAIMAINSLLVGFPLALETV